MKRDYNSEAEKLRQQEEKCWEFRISDVLINKNVISVFFIYGERLRQLVLLEKYYEKSKTNFLPEEEHQKQCEFEQKQEKLINGNTSEHINAHEGYAQKDFIYCSKELADFLAVVESDRETYQPKYIDTIDINDFKILKGRRGFMNIKKVPGYRNCIYWGIKVVPFAFYPVHKDPKGLKNIFSELSIKELSKILSLTIKQDNHNKILVFCTYLSAIVLQGLQMNVFISGKSGSGKTYNGEEISQYYPKNIEFLKRSCTPRALNIDMDWKQKVLVFQDLADPRVLTFLRPSESHDGEAGEEAVNSSMVPNSLKPVNTIWKYFHATIVRTATFELKDKQDKRRYWNISPENTPKKNKEIKVLNDKYPSYRTNPEFRKIIFNNHARRFLMERILYIRQAEIKEVIIGNVQYLEDKTKNTKFNPTYRVHLENLIMVLAFLNCFNRMNENGVLVANEQDVDAGIEIFNYYSRSRELGIAPYYLELYDYVLFPAHAEKNKNNKNIIGLEKSEIKEKYYQIYHEDFDDLEKAIEQWEYANLINYKKAPPPNGRNKLIYLNEKKQGN